MCYSIMGSLNTLFRENFKKCCKEKGYTQQEVADKLGISLDGLKHHLRKSNPYLPSVDLLYKMAKIFDVDISYLIGEINSPKCSMQAISEITGINDRSISLITRNTSQFMPGFCFLINAISKSGHLEEFSSLIEELSFLDSSLINIKDSQGNGHNIFYNSKPAEAKVLKVKILSLFDIILDEIIFDDHLWDQDAGYQMSRQLLDAIDKNEHRMSHDELVDYVHQKLDEIIHVNACEYITCFSPEQIIRYERYSLRKFYSQDRNFF